MASNSNVAADKFELTSKLLSTFKPAKVFTEQVQKNTEITSLSFDDKGEFLVTAGNDETIQLFNCKTGKHVKTLFSKKYGVHLARFTHKSSSIIYASTKEDDTIRYHSLHDNKYLQYFRGHKNKVVTLQMSPKDDTFISGAVDDSIRLWDLRSPNCQGMMKIQGHPVVAYDLTGAVFALALNERGVISLYDAAKFEQRPFLTIILDDKEHLSKVTMPPRIPIITSLEFSNSGNDLLVGTSGDVHYIVRSVELDKEDPNPVFLQRRLIGFEGLENVSGGGGRGTGMVPDAGLSGSECCWTPDGKFVISGSASGKIYIWEIPSQPLALGEDPNLRPCATIDGHTGVSRCVAFNPRTSVMASAGSQMALWLPEESES